VWENVEGDVVVRKITLRKTAGNDDSVTIDATHLGARRELGNDGEE
jgi:hypothetical protein